MKRGISLIPVAILVAAYTSDSLADDGEMGVGIWKITIVQDDGNGLGAGQARNGSEPRVALKLGHNRGGLLTRSYSEETFIRIYNRDSPGHAS